MKKGVYLLFILILASQVIAGSLNVDFTTQTPDLLPGKEVDFTITLQNPTSIDQFVKVKSIDLNWLMDSIPLDYALAAGTTEEFQVHFRPLSNVGPGNHGLNLILESSLDRVELLLPVSVTAYSDLLNINLQSLDKIDPRQNNILNLEVENTKRIDLENVKVELSSELFNKIKVISLSSEETKIIDFPIELNKNVLEGEYQVTAKITYQDELLNEENFSILIAPYSNLKEARSQSQSFLVNQETVQKSNEGNVRVVEVYSRPFTFFAKTFTSFNPQPNRIIKTNGKYSVEWDLDLAPNEVASISYSTNYRAPFFSILAILVILSLIYYFTRRSILVNKKVISIQPKKGKISSLKIRLYIKNTSSKTLKNIKVLDRVPIVKKAPNKFTGLKPTSSRSSGRGASIMWIIPSLRSGEEKVLSYVVEENIDFKGSLLLPPAIVRYNEKKESQLSKSKNITLFEK